MMTNDTSCPVCGKPVENESGHGLCEACLMAQAMASQTRAVGRERSLVPERLGSEKLAEKFPQYDSFEYLGRGGMGVVYKARQKSLDRWVALKVLAPERTEEERFADHFAREAKTLAKMNHANIVTVFDHGETDGLFFIVMEFVDGVNLRDLLTDGKMEPEQALAIVPSICDALEFAHNKGVVHRDIKPENILLDKDGRVKIADFGIASLVGTPGEKSGTPNYMAPEQEKGQVDKRADIYAVGVVLYEMLTGERLSGGLVSPTQKMSIDAKLEEVVLRALEREPSLRYQTAGELRTVVNTLLQNSEFGDLKQSKRKPRAKFSATAVGGVVLNCLLVPGLVGMIVINFWIGRIVRSGGEMPVLARFFFETQIIFYLLFGLSLLSGCLLGWISFLRIRRSRGELSGFGPAVFASLLLPLLLLDNLVYLLVWGFASLFSIPSSIEIVLIGSLCSVLVNYKLIGWVWQKGCRSADGEELLLVGKKRWTFATLAIGVLLSLLLLGIVFLKVYDSGLSSRASNSRLSELSPQEIRKLPTRNLIAYAVAQPISPWAWQELEKRELDEKDTWFVMKGLSTWLRQEHPDGLIGPLTWVSQYLNELAKRDNVNQEQVVEFIQLLHGPLRGMDRMRIREGEEMQHFSLEVANHWEKDLMGLTLLTELESVLLNGEPCDAEDQTSNWDMASRSLSLAVGDAPLGTNLIQLSVKSALVPTDHLIGFDRNAPSVDWPAAVAIWQRQAELSLEVFPSDARLVRLVTDSSLSPLNDDKLHWKPILIHQKGRGLEATLRFQIQDDSPVAFSFDVELQIGGQRATCGSIWAIPDKPGRVGRRGASFLSADLKRLDQDVKSAKIVLRPNPRVIEHFADIDTVWNSEIQLIDVEVQRFDKSEASEQ